MSKKKRIKELERRVALLEAEVAGLRPFPAAWPQITCTASKVDGASLSKMLKREARTSGLGMN
jgi:hypothetical protein